MKKINLMMASVFGLSLFVHGCGISAVEDLLPDEAGNYEPKCESPTHRGQILTNDDGEELLQKDPECSKRRARSIATIRTLQKQGSLGQGPMITATLPPAIMILLDKYEKTGEEKYKDAVVRLLEGMASEDVRINIKR